MPQIIIHAPKLDKNSVEIAKLLNRIRSNTIELLSIDEKFGQVVLYETRRYARSIHYTRNPDFILVEINMLLGRPSGKKYIIMDMVIKQLEEFYDIKKENIQCFIHEISPENYYGGYHRTIK